MFDVWIGRTKIRFRIFEVRKFQVRYNIYSVSFVWQPYLASTYFATMSLMTESYKAHTKGLQGIGKSHRVHQMPILVRFVWKIQSSSFHHVFSFELVRYYAMKTMRQHHLLCLSVMPRPDWKVVVRTLVRVVSLTHSQWTLEQAVYRKFFQQKKIIFEISATSTVGGNAPKNICIPYVESLKSLLSIGGKVICSFIFEPSFDLLFL